MQKTSRVANPRLSLLTISGVAFACALGFVPRAAIAQAGGAAHVGGMVDPQQSLNWQPGAIGHDQRMRKYRDVDNGTQPTPPIIPRFELDADQSGAVATFQPGGATITSNNAFFQDLGTNNRTCFTCHQPTTGWGVSAASVQARFAHSSGSDPIFRLVDGAICPTDNVSTYVAKLRAYKLLLEKGLIRIGLALPTPTQTSPCSRSDQCGRPIQLPHQSRNRPHQPHGRHHVDVSSAAAVDQSRFPVDSHVGWPRAESLEIR